MNKVKLPREVVEELDSIKASFSTNPLTPYGVLKVFEGKYPQHHDLDRIMLGLVNGYEAEQSPEEQVKRSFDGFLDAKMEPFDYGAKEHTWFQAGMRTTLNILNIKIEGVNA